MSISKGLAESAVVAKVYIHFFAAIILLFRLMENCGIWPDPWKRIHLWNWLSLIILKERKSSGTLLLTFLDKLWKESMELSLLLVLHSKKDSTMIPELTSMLNTFRSGSPSRTVSQDDFDYINATVNRLTNEKQTFERLTVPKEVALEMFKVL